MHLLFLHAALHSIFATLHSIFPVLSCLDCFQDLPRLLRILQNSKRSVSRHWRERRLSHDSGDAANLARKWNWISPVTLDEGTSTCNSSEPLASLSLTGLRTSRLAKNIDLTWATPAGYKFSDDVSGRCPYHSLPLMSEDPYKSQNLLNGAVMSWCW